MFNINIGHRALLIKAQKVMPFTSCLSIVLAVYGFYLAYFASPPDVLHGENVRFMYLHVPAAWNALFLYALLGISAGMFIIGRVRLFEMCAMSLVVPGTINAGLCLVTGALWGKPAWGTWWVWDARLTAMLLLFILYVALWMMLAEGNSERKYLRPAAYVTFLGALDLPIIHFSVKWWNTLHQPSSIIRLDGVTIHHDMLKPLLVMSLAFLFISLNTSLLCLAIQSLHKQKKKTGNL